MLAILPHSVVANLQAGLSSLDGCDISSNTATDDDKVLLL
jgi:hypothetical protein